MRSIILTFSILLTLALVGALCLVLGMRNSFPTPIDDGVTILPVPGNRVSTTTVVGAEPALRDSGVDEPRTVRKLDDPKVREQVYAALVTKWAPIDFEGTLLATSSQFVGWTIEYQHVFGLLFVAVTDYPGFMLQREAETVLLRDLEMTEEEACQLGVQVTWRNIETDYEFDRRRLTFCEQ